MRRSAKNGATNNHARRNKYTPSAFGARCFCLVFQMETVDFFQNEATRCRDNAKMAISKDDREFWLNMANRWETMQRITKRETPEVEVGTIEHPRAA
jgi:hypothetical protein